VQTFFVPLDGGETRQLTSGLGRARGFVSPDGSHIASVASFSTKPPELYLKTADADGLGEQLTDSPSPAFKSYDWIDPPIVHITAQDGTMVPAQVYAPEEGTASGAGVVFVHGAGYRQNVHRWWRGSSYGRSYCFQHLLMQAGYTVIDIDFRGSEGYGRDWRTAIYRSMGDKDLSDQVDGARYLMENYGVEPGRIGIYGGSYGGFITLMAMFKEGDVFTAGVAMRPVTDWAAYNHPYTSNILNTPQEDPEAYLFSSPIYHAEGLKGHLLITHGIEDNNVHIQGVFRLVQRLIELRKKNWDVAVYPIEPHGFREPSSWVDQYYRIKKLFDETLHP
jgi:dipeptidyl aminopeptidase/acylaminoacyl peptidase